MINPEKIINYERTTVEKQELILFLPAVAGKKASQMSKQLQALLRIGYKRGKTPFEFIKMFRSQALLENYLRMNKLFGCYTSRAKSFWQLAHSDLDLDTCTFDDLMGIHGVARKSASCFLSWTRGTVDLVMLDTHLLRFMRKLRDDLDSLSADLTKDEKTILGLLKSVKIPKSTPSSARVYNTLEQAFMLTAALNDKNPTEFDLEIWKSYSKGLTSGEGGARV